MRFPALPHTLAILLLFSLDLAYADRNVTIDNLDTRVILTPLPAWGWSNQGHGENGGTFSFSNTENATVTLTFLQNATAVFWQGFKRSGPALYSVCIDCTDTSQGELVDGRDTDEQAINSVTTLFAQTGLANGPHTITITNLIDPRLGLPSQITVDAFILTIPEPSSVSTSTASTATQSPTTRTVVGNPSPTTVAYWSDTHSTAVLSTGAIAGIALAGGVALLGIVALGWWLLRRRRVNRRKYGTVFGHDNEKRPESPMASTLKMAPRNAEQAAMFGSSATYASYKVGARNPESPFSSPAPPYPASIPLTHSSRAPSIRSAISSLLSRTPSTRSRVAPSEWGTIPVVLSNPFASPHDADADTDIDSAFDYDTPLPSSTLASSFPGSGSRTSSTLVNSPNSAPNGLQMAMQPTPRVVVSLRGSDSEDTNPENTRGWRRVES